MPSRARSLFAFVAVPSLELLAPFDARVEVVRGGREHARTFRGVPSLPGFLPWSRIHVNLPPGGDAVRITISVRAASDETVGPLDFQVDAIGWTSRRNG